MYMPPCLHRRCVVLVSVNAESLCMMCFDHVIYGLTKFLGSVASLNSVSTVISTDTTVVESPPAAAVRILAAPLAFPTPLWSGGKVVDWVPFNLFEMIASALLASDFLCSSSLLAFCSFVSLRAAPIFFRWRVDIRQVQFWKFSSLRIYPKRKLTSTLPPRVNWRSSNGSCTNDSKTLIREFLFSLSMRSVISQHRLKTPSMPVIPNPSMTFCVRRKGTFSAMSKWTWP